MSLSPGDGRVSSPELRRSSGVADPLELFRNDARLRPWDSTETASSPQPTVSHVRSAWATRRSSRKMVGWSRRARRAADLGRFPGLSVPGPPRAVRVWQSAARTSTGQVGSISWLTSSKFQISKNLFWSRSARTQTLAIFSAENRATNQFPISLVASNSTFVDVDSPGHSSVSGMLIQRLPPTRLVYCEASTYTRALSNTIRGWPTLLAA